MSTSEPIVNKPVVINLKFTTSEAPVFEVDKMRGIIKYGKDNKYANYLLNLFDKSSTHNAVVTGKAQYIFGKGLTYSNENLAPEAKANYDNFLKRINPVESADQLLKKLILDHEVFYGFAVEVIPNAGHTKIVAFNHLDFSKIRISADYSEYWYSDFWAKPDKLKNEGAIRKFKPYNPDRPDYTQSTIIYFKSYRPNVGAYPTPDYMGAIDAIETDIRISSFHLNNIRNGFWASKIINFNNGVPTEEEQDAIEKMVEEKFTGNENAGRFMLTFNDGSERASTAVELAPGSMDKQFEQLRKDTSAEIFIGHKVVSPVLFGVSTPGALGQRNEMIDAFELFQNGYISIRQQLFTSFINELAKIKGLEPRFEILPTEPIGAKLQLEESTIAANLDRAEIRELINKEYGLNLKVEAPAPTSAIPAPTQLSEELDDDKDLGVFLKYGTEKGKFERVHSKACAYKSEANMRSYHAAFRRVQFKDVVSISAKDKEVLKSLEGKNPPDIEVKTLDRLREQKLVELDQKTGLPRLTDLGELAISDIPDLDKHDISQLKVVYEYVKRPDADGPEVLTTTRPFCKAMCESDRYFSKDDIEAIGAEVGYDVFKKRGGWMTLPDGNHRPSCRHIWQQVLVKEII